MTPDRARLQCPDLVPVSRLASALLIVAPMLCACLDPVLVTDVETDENQTITLTTRGGAANLSGIEVWRGTGEIPGPGVTADPGPPAISDERPTPRASRMPAMLAAAMRSTVATTIVRAPARRFGIRMADGSKGVWTSFVGRTRKRGSCSAVALGRE